MNIISIVRKGQFFSLQRVLAVWNGRRVVHGHHRRSQNYDTLLLYLFLPLSDLLDQVILIVVIVVYEVFEVVVAREPAMHQATLLLPFLFVHVPIVVVLCVQLERCFPLSLHRRLFVFILIAPFRLFLFSFSFLRITFATSFMWRVVEQFDGKGLQLGQNVCGPRNPLVILEGFVIFAAD